MRQSFDPAGFANRNLVCDGETFADRVGPQIASPRYFEMEFARVDKWAGRGLKGDAVAGRRPSGVLVGTV
jgi:hypothetical protein